MTARIRHNDWSSLRPAPLGAWTPRLSVSVVIPAYQCQDALDRTLAALAAQSYPADLTEVVVADDGSATPLVLPPLAPHRTRIVRVPKGSWGRGAARQTGASAASGDVIHWLDADMLLDREHIEAHMRWHHLSDHVVVHGTIRFSDSTDEPTADHVYAETAAGRSADLFPAESVHPHVWLEKTLAETRHLRDARSNPSRLHSGATTSVRATLLARAGGVDVTMNMGEDTELGYRLAQAGAVFIPDAEALSWHLGRSTVMLREKEVHRHNWTLFADRIPDLRWLRTHPRRIYSVPYVEVITTATTYEETRGTVDSALAGTIHDLSVTIDGPWHELTTGRRASLDEPMLDLRLLGNLYAGEPRVNRAVRAPFRLRIPAGWALGADSVAKLVRLAEKEGYGLVCAALAETHDGVAVARLERTAAFNRARLFPGEDPDDLVDELFGAHWVDGAEFGVVPLDEAGPVKGDAQTWRVAAEKHKAEAARLRAEAERWKAEAEKLAAQPQGKRRWRSR
ncbi:glycosyltransferase family 2 protein [Herbidospora cretacea]|uniref:glycosyltransferase family 2 protein n=1 Tax=Herbidospora cretacea TaxID=28444 RepID=UPI000774903B|nr:glycosyltransferase [Herbidospora cretacea]